jgi:hypothetical protein
MKKHLRSSEGVYTIRGKTYKELVGSRAQVFHGNAYKTSGGLIIKDLIMNKSGRIVSLAKHKTAKREKRLAKAGYTTKPGVFGCFKPDGKKCKTKKRR